VTALPYRSRKNSSSEASDSCSIVIVGNGMAGSRLAQELRARDADLEITVIGAEQGGAYNRVLLSHVLAGTVRAEDIVLARPDWYAAHRVRLHAGVRAAALDRDARVVRTDAACIRYDALVLATGSTAVVPPIDGIDAALPFRTLHDCAAILDRAAAATRAVVIGGGLLGLEAARGLAGRGLPTTVVHMAGHLMERQLDAGAGRVLGRTLSGMGIEVLTDACTAAVDDAGVLLADGRHLSADLVVLACGVRPDVELAQRAGLAVERGVLVDDQLRSITDERVYAIGECAQHDGQVYGLVAPCWEQARVLADVLAGRTAAYGGTRTVTRLKAAGVELAAMGETDTDTADLVTFADAARGIYQKLLLRDERIVGAILLGDTRAAGTVTQLFDRGPAAPHDRAALLFGGAARAEAESPTLIPDRATICQCNGVTKGAIRDAWQAGARSVTEIASTTRATTGCGTCRDTVCGLLGWLSAADAQPALEAS
jgi:assimilatory nitrate reductase electron transfer subunit